MTENALATEIVDVAYRIHTTLGPGLFESVYEAILASELQKRGLQVVTQQAIPVVYEGTRFEMGFRADLVVEDKVIVEIKSVAEVAAVHKKQLLSYLRLSNKALGFTHQFQCAADQGRYYANRERTGRMIGQRIAWHTLATMLLTGAALAQNGSSDPTFQTIPFDRWLTERDQAHFQWNAKVSGGNLTNSQRLGATVEIDIDGNELAKRRGRGELAIFIQFSDADHRVFQSHGALQLKDATEEAAKSTIEYRQAALVTPGEYRVDIAMLDTNTGEHATLTRTLRVLPLRNDPLPDSMKALPLVEFGLAGDPPDSWYQPELTGRLHLPLETKRPLRIEVLANASPSSIGPRFRSGELNSRILADLLPGLKVFSQIELSQGDLNVSLIDLTRRQVLFAQQRVDPVGRALDWLKLRPALLQADPNKINVRELSDSRSNPQFFVKEVRRLTKTEAALIVLSGPIAFAPSDDRRPIELEESPQGRVFYLRFHPLPVRRNIDETIGRRRGGLGQSPSALLTQEPPDSLAGLLKPLQPRVYDIYTPDQFRKALAEVMREISKM